MSYCLQSIAPQTLTSCQVPPYISFYNLLQYGRKIGRCFWFIMISVFSVLFLIYSDKIVSKFIISLLSAITQSICSNFYCCTFIYLFFLILNIIIIIIIWPCSWLEVSNPGNNGSETLGAVGHGNHRVWREYEGLVAITGEVISLHESTQLDIIKSRC